MRSVQHDVAWIRPQPPAVTSTPTPPSAPPATTTTNTTPVFGDVGVSVGRSGVEEHGRRETPLVSSPSPSGRHGPLAARLQQLGAVGPTTVTTDTITTATITRALTAADTALTAARPRTGLEDLLEHPHDAFFAVQNLVEDGETWHDLAARITVSPDQLLHSERTPVTLPPMNVALFRGCLFPDAYFMRSTLYWNEVREQLAHVGTFDITAFTRRMPFIDLRGTIPGGLALDGGPARVHLDGGARQLLEMLVATADIDDGHLTAWRACSRSEVEVQRFVRDLLASTKAAPDAADWARLDAIFARFDDEVCQAVAQAAPRGGTREEVAAAIADVLGGQNRATFVGFDRTKALDFQETDDDGEAVEVIVRYRLPLAALAQHVERGTLYLGIEFDALEAGFGAHLGDASDQETKFLLYRALVDD